MDKSKFPVLVSLADPPPNEPPKNPACEAAQEKSEHRFVRKFKIAASPEETLHGNHDRRQYAKRYRGPNDHHSPQALFVFGDLSHGNHFDE